MCLPGALTIDSPCVHQVRFVVVAKPSLALVVGGGEGADLPRRADLVVSEIFGDDPLAEGVRADACSLVITPTLLDARDTLRHASMTFPGHHPSSTPPQPLRAARCDRDAAACTERLAGPWDWCHDTGGAQAPLRLGRGAHCGRAGETALSL
jgi:hypothetical protein